MSLIYIFTEPLEFVGWESVVSCVRTQHGLKVKSGLYVYTGPGGAVVQG